MKRYNNLFDRIVNIDNLYLADKKARKNKSNRNDIKQFDQNKEELLKKLQQDLINGTYKTSDVGYVIRHDYTLVRKNIKRSMCRKAARLGRKKNITVEDYKQEMCSHIGWLKHCNGINLLKKILRYKELLVYARRFSKQKL